jgi:hypothetical protein
MERRIPMARGKRRVWKRFDAITAKIARRAADLGALPQMTNGHTKNNANQ